MWNFNDECIVHIATVGVIREEHTETEALKLDFIVGGKTKRTV